MGVWMYSSTILYLGTRWRCVISFTPRQLYPRGKNPVGFRAGLNIKKLNSVALVRERTIPTERPPLVGEVVPTFSNRGCRVVSATDSHGR
jgi:hypothetical protein